jgi:hypothetical protein
MEPQRIAADFDKYMRFYRRKVKDTDGQERAQVHGDHLRPSVEPD